MQAYNVLEYYFINIERLFRGGSSFPAKFGFNELLLTALYSFIVTANYKVLEVELFCNIFIF